jgi:hypothetical protein
MVSELLISVFIDINNNDRQLLGSMELHGTAFYGMSGNEYGMRSTYMHLRWLTGTRDRDTINES